MRVNGVKETLDLYLGGAYKPDSLIIRIWLFYKGPDYTFRRESLRRKQAKIRNGIRLRKEIMKPNTFITSIEKGHDWARALLQVPFKNENT